MRALLVAGAVVGLAFAPSPAHATDTSVVAEITGGPGWRVALGQDARNPGFASVTGGADVLLGLQVGGAWAIVAGGRVRAGAADGESYFELSGDLGAQLAIGDRVRARLGASAGKAWQRGLELSAAMVGGFAAFSFDLFLLGTGRTAAALAIRLDAGAFPGADVRWPQGTVSLTGGLGGRY